MSQNRYAGLVIAESLIEFLKSNYTTHTDKQLMAIIQNNPEWSYIDFPKLRHIKWLYGFIKQKQIPYTEEEKQFIRDNYLKMGDVDLAKHLPNHSFKSVHKQRRVIMGLRRDSESLLAIRKKGSQKAHAARERMKLEGTYYRSSDRKTGEIYRVNCTNYWYIKPDKNRLYKPLPYHRWLWEKEVGEIPKGYLVRFKDGIIPDDYKDITIDILECVPQSVHAAKVASLMGDNYVAGRLFYKAKKIDLNSLKELGILELKRYSLTIKREAKKDETN